MLIRKLTLHVVLVALVITVPHPPIGHMIHIQPIRVPHLPIPRHWSKGVAQVGPIRDLPWDLSQKLELDAYPAEPPRRLIL